MHPLTLALLTTSLFSMSTFAKDPSCPGVAFQRGDDSNSVSGCCVGGSVQTPYLSTCPGWPICTGPATTTTTSSPIVCATILMASDQSYGAMITSASSSLKASGTHPKMTLTGDFIAQGSQSTESSGSNSGSDSSSSSSEGSASALGLEVGALGAALLGVAALL